MPAESKTAVIAAITANIFIAATKFVAASVTGSAAMLSEGIHSVVDAGDSAFLLLGLHQSKRPADRTHPFGHGKELYFWTLVVAVMIFGVGGGMGLYEGIHHLQRNEPPKDPTWNYWVLGIAFVAESISLTVGLRQFFKQKPKDRSFFRTITTAKDPTLFTVISEDSTDLVGLATAFAGVWLGQQFNSPIPDGIASIVIGLVLMMVAVFLAYQSRNLLIGEGAAPEQVDKIESVAANDADVESVVVPPLTMHFGPHDVLVTLGVRFRRGLDVDGLERAVDRIERSIRQAVPTVRHVFIEAASFSGRNGGADRG